MVNPVLTYIFIFQMDTGLEGLWIAKIASEIMIGAFYFKIIHTADLKEIIARSEERMRRTTSKQ